MTQQMLVGYGPTGFRITMTGPEGPVEAMLGIGAAGPVLSTLGPFNTIVAGAAGSGRLVDIPTAQFLALPNGTLAWVASVQAYFYRLTAPTAVSSDSLTILKPLGGVSREVWVRLPTPTPYWAGRPNWFVDEAAGSNENLGTTSGAALASYDELQRRIAGPDGVISCATQITVNQIGDYAGSWAPIVQVLPNGGFTLQGVLPAASFTGVIAAKTDYVAGVSFQAATSTWNPTTELKRLVHDETADLWAWVAKDNTGNSARLSPWMVKADLLTPTIANAAVADTVSTFVLPKIGALFITTLAGGVPIAQTTQPVLVNFLEITGTAGRPRLNGSGNQLIFQCCKFSTNTARIGTGNVTMNGCNIDINGTIEGNDTPGFMSWNACLASSANYAVNRFSVLTVNVGTLHQNCQLQLVTGRVTTGDAAWADTADPILASVDAVVNVTSANTWGSGNTGVGVRMHRASDMVVSNGVTPRLTGNVAGVDFSVGASNTARPFDNAAGAYVAAVNCSWADLLAAVGAGGFGGSLFDPASGCRVVVDV